MKIASPIHVRSGSRHTLEGREAQRELTLRVDGTTGLFNNNGCFGEGLAGTAVAPIEHRN
ncbi:MAG: hypothetical protein OXI88_02685 [Gammaproteobacteria bacterium]|nr:hypothetical protein [Gammaproteobacteria bacterium]MDE0282983.1 hypothetical protein [Gammaproteobacteria bacterium]MDE0510678.1 hypothetical protein [Gammaproteobacteria bacterium]